ncbi:hypothetical protein LQR31_10435 [Chromobacterium vaccinii]|uniref:hypothetical protein n=1 Tax=Chromobacterium vaccinii TaxID=1108595 RepID=UPI001E440DC2|nr:hypothetical protein [Chromobacterium vaccinii]MCD4484890.1 hypothetical protein [Chromobacterium vaccinii]
MRAAKETTMETERMSYWARSWGIHQFQQVGRTPISLWRELRSIPMNGDAAINNSAKTIPSVNGPHFHHPAINGYFAIED